MTNEVFPEDSGLNQNLDPDWSDAAHFAQLARPIDDKYVIKGMGINVDFGDPTFDIDPGVFTLVMPEGSTQDHTNDNPSKASQTLEELRLVGDYDGENDIALQDNDVNHVWVEIDLTAANTIDVIVNTTGNDPEGSDTPTMKYAVIDTNDDTYRLTNRGPRYSETLNFTGGTTKTVTHSIGEKYPANVTLYDQNDTGFEPSSVRPVNEDQIEIETATNKPDCQVVITK